MARAAIIEALAQALARSARAEAPAVGEDIVRRAEQTGHTVPAYRGLSRIYDDAAAQMRADEGRAQWFSRRPLMAHTYAFQGNPPLEGGNILPAMLRLGRGLEIDAGNAPWNLIDATTIPDKDVYHALRPIMRRTVDASTVTTRDLADAVRKAGYDSLTIRNMRHAFMSQPDDVYAVFNPADVRARWAAFDPERAHINDLLAGSVIAVPTVGLSLREMLRRQAGEG